MLVLDDILEWASSQEPWKQDLIRRIIENGDYTESDVEEVSKMVLAASGYDVLLEKVPIPIKPKVSRPTKKFDSKKIVLQKIENLLNVNALCDESSLSFAQDGLTVIYGENGVGKSGYTRVLKKVCKAREIDPVLPNVFKNSSDVKIGADIHYSVNDETMKSSWDDSKDEEPFLEQIVVHDSKCAKIQVNGSNELFYLPGGADIFSKIIDFMEKVKKKVSEQKPAKVFLNLEGLNKNSDAFKLLNAINLKTEYSVLKEGLTWDKDNEEELNLLNKQIVDANEEEVNKKVKSWKSLNIKIDKIKGMFIEVNNILNAERLQGLIEKRKQLDEAREAVENINSELAGCSEIDGTGGELWKIMYEAAKEYSNKVAYTDSDFPHTSGVCVLCQQDLSESARLRLESFQKYIEGKVNKKAKEMQEWHDKSEGVLNSTDNEIEKLSERINDLDSYIPEEIMKTVTGAVSVLKINLEVFRQKLKQYDFETVPLKTILVDTILGEYTSNIKNKIEEANESLKPEVLIKLKEQREGLTSRKLAANLVPQAESYLKFLEEEKMFKDVVRKLETGSISRKGKGIITDVLRKSFIEDLKNELMCLGGERIPLHVNSSTKGGEPNFQLALEGGDIPKKCNLDAVLSEGEQKIVSIAGFLAELNLAKHKNGIIFDDPVTSLDHKFREKIAKRLVKEAKKRQVIIFTHDISFLFSLKQNAIELNVSSSFQNIKRDGDRSGVISLENPWHAQRTKERVTTLRNMHQKIKSCTYPSNDFNLRAASIYGRIRETWERFVEEVLLNQVVMRFDQVIQTQRLNGVFVDDDTFKYIFQQVAKASKYMDGHDKSLPLVDRRPDEKEILQDIEELNKCLKETNKKIEETGRIRRAIISEPPKAKVMV